jgi:DNA-binding NarL/FixJ family response regulator
VTHTVLLADDDALVRDGLRVLVDLEDDFSVVAVAANGAEALAAWREHHPAIVLMDIRMPVLDGVEATRRIIAEDPKARVLVLTTFQDDEYVHSAIESGATGYLLKSQSAESILAAMRAACAGTAVLDPAVIRSLSGPAGNAAAQTTSHAADTAPSDLSEREQAVLHLVGEGKSNREIAATLFLGEGTVRNYVSDLLFKLNLRDRTQLAIFYHTRPWAGRRSGKESES